jgi:ribosomal protein S18 acetylase RimI-like enzyme
MGDDDHLRIRRATADDADAVADVWLASFKATYPFPPAHPDEDVRRWIRDEIVPRDETFVAVEADRGIVGFMSLREDDVDHLYVHPDRFDRGIGSRFIEIAKDRRPSGLWLYTFQVNDRARRFYERRGFQVERFGDGESNEERQPDVRYVWKPGSTA